MPDRRLEGCCTLATTQEQAHEERKQHQTRNYCLDVLVRPTRYIVTSSSARFYCRPTTSGPTPVVYLEGLTDGDSTACAVMARLARYGRLDPCVSAPPGKHSSPGTLTKSHRQKMPRLTWRDGVVHSRGLRLMIVAFDCDDIDGNVRMFASIREKDDAWSRLGVNRPGDA